MSARDELIHVLRAAMAITAGVWLASPTTRFRPEQRDPAKPAAVSGDRRDAAVREPADVPGAAGQPDRSRDHPLRRRVVADAAGECHGIEPFAPIQHSRTPLTGRCFAISVIDYSAGRRERIFAWLVRVLGARPSLPPEVFVEDESTTAPGWSGASRRSGPVRMAPRSHRASARSAG